METIKQKTEDCCPTFHSEKGHVRTLNWKNKHFIKASTPTLFHIPFQKMLGNKITKMMKQVEDSIKMIHDKVDVLLLIADPHPFRSDMYLSVTDDVLEAKNYYLHYAYCPKSTEYKGHKNMVPFAQI